MDNPDQRENSYNSERFMESTPGAGMEDDDPSSLLETVVEDEPVTKHTVATNAVSERMK
jgi:predicted hydrolase (HD superfamily)